MMQYFRQKFIEEANDLINDLEKAVLALDTARSDSERIRQVFRIMHTLKGNGSMFGFDTISELAHELESIYEYVRDGLLPLSDTLLNISFDAVDHLKRLIADSMLTDPANMRQHNMLLQKINTLLAEIGTKELVADKGPEPELKTGSPNLYTYYVGIWPKPGIMQTGTNPLYLLDELSSLGHCKTFAITSDIPPLENLNPTDCYVHWHCLLVSQSGIASIKDVFIFAEDDIKLEIKPLAAHNLFVDATFEQAMALIPTDASDTDIQTLLETIDNQVAHAGQATIQKTAVPKLPQPSFREKLMSNVKVPSAKMDELMNLVSELVIAQARLNTICQRYANDSELASLTEQMEKIARQLRESTFSISLVPLEHILIPLHRLVRDLSSELSKEVVLVTEGTETELDKSIIDSLSEPLTHILRNSIDHGIEPPHERKLKGKPRQGKILLKAYYTGANVAIEISDDGAGINLRQLREKALAKGLINKQAHLNDKQALDLIFLSGLSTAQTLTEVSGRGVGMDVVKQKIADLRGNVQVQSVANVGTTLTLTMPLTLSILDGLLIQAGEHAFIIPLTCVDKCYEAGPTQFYDDTLNQLMALETGQLPYIRLSDELDIPGPRPAIEQVVVVNCQNRQVAIVVDQIKGQYQAVIKSLGKVYKNLDIVSGATILGNGSIALVIDCNKLIQHFRQGQPYQL